jgi:hypothetical protein
MTRREFWEHIDKSRRKDSDAHAERLVRRLAKLPEREVLDFCHLWDEALDAAYTWNLWAAGYVINAGCSDDGFEYFRGWLVLQGRKVYEAALKDPDSLAAVIDPEEEFTEFEGRPGWDAWFAATGTASDDDAGYDALFAALEARPRKAAKRPGMGRAWNFDDDRKMRKRLPRLYALYTQGDDDE